jgi:membrane-associated phospholipid phosphatase
VSQVVPALFVPLAGCTLAAHWSLARTRAHHLTDVLAGGAMGIGVALAVAVLWPSKSGDGPSTSIEGDEARLLVHIEPDGKTPSDRA